MSVRTQPTGPLSGGSPSLRDYRRLRPGRSQSRTDVIASQRFRLQRAMIEIAAREGLDAVTVRKLTKVSGVSSRSFYTRFSGVEDCLLAAYGEVMWGAAQRIGAARSAELTQAEQVTRALRAFLEELLADRDVARFALIEIYAGGPAALAVIAAEERRLEAALRRCVDRRSQRVSEDVVAALVAASLRCARIKLIEASPEEAAQAMDALMEWARELVEHKDQFGVAAAKASKPSTARSVWDQGRAAAAERDEVDLLLAAVLRVALPHGFHGLTSGRVSSVAGLPAARFRRHFADLADGYLTALRRTCKSFFIELTSAADGDSAAAMSTRGALQAASWRAVADPGAARLTFGQIVEPGVAGLTCRESLISELATACTSSRSESATRVSIHAEASIAALWATLAGSAEARPAAG
jgi:AcrR family transcriptional regulator